MFTAGPHHLLLSFTVRRPPAGASTVAASMTNAAERRRCTIRHDTTDVCYSMGTTVDVTTVQGVPPPPLTALPPPPQTPKHITMGSRTTVSQPPTGRWLCQNGATVLWGKTLSQVATRKVFRCQAAGLTSEASRTQLVSRKHQTVRQQSSTQKEHPKEVLHHVRKKTSRSHTPRARKTRPTARGKGPRAQRKPSHHREPHPPPIWQIGKEKTHEPSPAVGT